MGTKLPPLEKRLGFVISDVARLFRRNFNRRVSEQYGITQAQWQILFHLTMNEGVKQAQIAYALEMQPISVARLIDRMEVSGWVERRPDPDDRRAFNVFLTDNADGLLEKLFAEGRAMKKIACKGLNDEQLAQLLDGLNILRENLILDTCKSTEKNS